MKTRHVVGTPDVAAARSVMQAARGQGIADDDIFLVARSDIELERISDDKKVAAMDFVPAALRGTLAGAVTGLLAGLVAVAIPPLGVTIAGAGALAGLGALVGTWSSALIGSSLPDPIRQMYDDEIKAGRILVVIDVTDDHLEQAMAAMTAAGGTPKSYSMPAALT